jgi:hypothetical protein
MVLTCKDVLQVALENDISAGQKLVMCPRPESHLTYMINIALTTQFDVDRDAR